MSARVDEQEVAVADVYASALLKLAEKRGEGDEVLEELEAIGSLLGDQPEFAAYLSSPMVDVEARRSAIDKTFHGRFNELLVNTLQVMNRRSRLDLLEALRAAYRRDLDEARKRESVEVTTAVPLTEGLREHLRQAVSRMTGRETRLIESVDETLIGGLVVKIGDQKIDTSVARSLTLLRQRFEERASAEVHAFAADSDANETDEVER
jgi:F-type H+-transporting ATPase subunit delta